TLAPSPGGFGFAGLVLFFFLLARRCLLATALSAMALSTIDLRPVRFVLGMAFSFDGREALIKKPDTNSASFVPEPREVGNVGEPPFRFSLKLPWRMMKTSRRNWSR